MDGSSRWWHVRQREGRELRAFASWGPQARIAVSASAVGGSGLAASGMIGVLQLRH